MTGYLGKQTNWPQDTIERIAEGVADRMWGPVPAVTTSAWNGRTVNVQPLYKPRVNADDLVMPELFEVPLDQPMTGNGGMTFPVPIGTPVMLTPQMRALDDWEEGGEGVPTDARSFHISNMRASLAGGESLSQNIENIDLENFNLRFNADASFGFKASPDGKFQMTGAEGNFIDLLASAIELIAADGLDIKSGSSQGLGVHALENRTELIEIAGKLRSMVL